MRKASQIRVQVNLFRDTQQGRRTEWQRKTVPDVLMDTTDASMMPIPLIATASLIYTFFHNICTTADPFNNRFDTRLQSNIRANQELRSCHNTSQPL